MKRTKEQKGITLIALIITIVVLLILAAVAISSIQDDGILHYAKNAADSWNEAQKNEQDMLSGYVDWLKYQTCSHTYVEGVCSNCGYSPCTEEHTVSEWTVTKEATCKTQTEGSRTGICNVCGKTVTETVYYKHTMISGANGEKCSVCGTDYCWDHIVLSGPYTQHENIGTHMREGVCVRCQKFGNFLVYDDGSWNEDSTCSVCGYKCPHGDAVWNGTNSGYHLCEVCENYVECTYNEFGNCACGNYIECEHDFEFDEDYSGVDIGYYHRCKICNSLNDCAFDNDYTDPSDDNTCSVCGHVRDI